MYEVCCKRIVVGKKRKCLTLRRLVGRTKQIPSQQKFLVETPKILLGQKKTNFCYQGNNFVISIKLLLNETKSGRDSNVLAKKLLNVLLFNQKFSQGKKKYGL